MSILTALAPAPALPCTCHDDLDPAVTPVVDPPAVDVDRAFRTKLTADTLDAYLKACRATERARLHAKRHPGPASEASHAAAITVDQAMEYPVIVALFGCCPGVPEDSAIRRLNFSDNARAVAYRGMLFIATGIKDKVNPNGLVVVDVRQVLDLDGRAGR